MDPLSKDDLREWFSTYAGPISPLLVVSITMPITRIFRLWVLSPGLPTFSFSWLCHSRSFGHVIHLFILNPEGIFSPYLRQLVCQKSFWVQTSVRRFFGFLNSHWLWKKFRIKGRIKEPPVPVLSKTSKNQQFSWKNQQRIFGGSLTY
jgi:hypothetical protein